MKEEEKEKKDDKKVEEKYLPIGTVVLLDGGTKKVMITSYLIFSTGDEKDKKMYDYGGCRYPEGVMDSYTGIGFNHEDIKEICHMGLVEDDDYKSLRSSLRQYGETMKKEFLKTLNKEKE